MDVSVDYVNAGRESYAIVSESTHAECAFEAPLFRRLSDHFAFRVFGLDLITVDLQRHHRDAYRRSSEKLDPGGRAPN